MRQFQFTAGEAERIAGDGRRFGSHAQVADESHLEPDPGRDARSPMRRIKQPPTGASAGISIASCQSLGHIDRAGSLLWVGLK
jgi:hypothetical protein